MRAGWYERNGPAAEVIEVGEMATPNPGPGEVLVRLHASGVNPSDVKRRDGWGGQVIDHPRVIPHSDGAGVIEAVGEGVSSSRAGQRVWVFNAQWKRAFGTAAEYVALPSRQAVPLPDATGFAAGACLGIPALTAHRCVFGGGPVDGGTILVTGGAGAVGNCAIQLAKWGGARVLATVSGAAKGEAATRAGADTVINYRDEDVAQRVLEITGGEGADRIVEVDFGDNLEASARAVKPNGVIAPYASMRGPRPTVDFYDLMRRNVWICPVFVYEMPADAFDKGFADIAAWLEGGSAGPAVGRSFGLDDLAAAHQAVESGEVVGNVVVEMAG